MRMIILDTETTGLTVEDGHRIVEIGCLEMVDRRTTGRHLHMYLNPERAIDEGAMQVHGITDEMVRDKPRFADCADEILDFVADAQILIHNAPFDVGFLDAELARIGRGRFRDACGSVLDTLVMARELHPGKRNSLDALCDRYGVSNAHRKLHGALLDAELLADVFLAMTRGQDSLEISLSQGGPTGADDDGHWPPEGLVVVLPTTVEVEAHASLLEAMRKDARGPSLWTRLQAPEPAPEGVG